MFPQHDPYFHLIQAVAEVNGCKIKLEHQQQQCDFQVCHTCSALDETILQYFLAGLKTEKQNLIESLKESYVHIDYEKRFLRTAYMLLYFPFYIEPIYCVVIPHLTQILPKNKSEIKICFIGGGPLPELLGLGKALSTVKSVKKINCTVLDLVPHWRIERKHYTQKMMERDYFPIGECIIRQEKFNLWDEILIVPDIIKEADIIISQNCLNDCEQGKDEIVYNNFRVIWNNMKKGASLILIDLKYAHVEKLLSRIDQMCLVNHGEVLQELKYGEINRNNFADNDFSFKKCTHIEENLGQSKLYVKYYSTICKKVN